MAGKPKQCWPVETKNKLSLALEAVDPDDPLRICVSMVELNLAKVPPALDAAKAAIDRYADALTKKRQQVGDLLLLPIAQTKICARTVNTLEANGVYTVGDLLATRRVELLEIPNFGRAALEEVYLVLLAMGFPVPDAEAIGMVRGK